MEADVLLIGGMWALTGSAQAPRRGYHQTFWGEIGFKWSVVRGHRFFVMVEVSGFYTAIFLCSFGEGLAEPSSLEAGVFN